MKNANQWAETAEAADVGQSFPFSEIREEPIWLIGIRLIVKYIIVRVMREWCASDEVCLGAR